MSKKFLILIVLFFGFYAFSALAADYSCNSLNSQYGDKIAEYDADDDKKITIQESISALKDYLNMDLAEGYFLAIVRFDRNNCSLPEKENDPVSGTLSVNKTEVQVGEEIKLTVTGEDADGLSYLWAYYHHGWHKDYADGTEFTSTFSFSESEPGSYVYRGYVYGQEPGGLRETTWTEPRSVTVTVTQKQDCENLYWFDDDHLTCGYKEFCGLYMYQGLQTFERLEGCQQALSQVLVDCNSYGSQYWCASYDEWSLECRGKGEAIHLGNKLCYSNGNKQRYCVTCQAPEDNHTLSGSLSVSKTNVEPGESFNLTISAQDGDGVKMMKAFWDNEWHTTYCNGKTSCSETHTLRETEPGDHGYFGYVFGYLPDNNLEYAWTDPKAVTVNVSSVQETGPDLIVSSVSVNPNSPDSDDAINFKVTIKNIGNETMPYVSGGVITKSSSGSLGFAGYKLCDAMTKRLGPSESTTIDCQMVQTLSAGSHNFTFLVDSSNKLEELDENNNSKTKSFSVSSADSGSACTDSDGGANFYEYGEAWISISGGDSVGTMDCCKNNYSTYMGDIINGIGPGGGPCVDSGPYLYEAICEGGVPYMMVYQCPNGCQNGVCKSQ